MVGGCSPEGDDRKRVCSRLHVILGDTVRISNVAAALCTSGHPPHHDYLLSPPGKWYGGKSSQAAQGRSTCQGGGSGRQETSGISSAQLVLGQPLILPGELKDVAEAPADDFSSQLASGDPPPTCQLRSYAAVAASNITNSRQLQEAHYVYVRRGGTISPLAPVYSGLYRLLHAGPKVFSLEVGATRESVSIDWLKPHTGPLPVIPALPATRGCPKK